MSGRVDLTGLGQWWDFGWLRCGTISLLGFIANGVAGERKHSADPRGPPCSKDTRPRARAQVGGT